MVNMTTEESTLKLFSGLPITDTKSMDIGNVEKVNIFNKKTIPKGFIFDPKIIEYYDYKYLYLLVKKIDEMFNLSPEKMNASFHKSWTKVRDTPIEQLLTEQIIHYITTYGFESLGIFDENTVFVPKEKLEIPGVEVENIKLRYINGYTWKELIIKLKTLLSGIALDNDTLKNAVNLCKVSHDFDEKQISDLGNKEARCMLYDAKDIIPDNPIEVLRLLIYILTGETLIIKNERMINKLQEETDNESKVVDILFKRRVTLSSIFYRYKPLFLAIRKGHPDTRNIINRIRRFAKTNHVPMRPDFLNDITNMISSGYVPVSDTLKKELEKVNVWRKIRLAYALKYRMSDKESIMYRIRNGKSYAKEMKNAKHYFQYERAYGIVIDSIVNSVRKNINGKTFYIPKNVMYTLPSTQKMFTGNFPTGTYFEIPERKSGLIGIHWMNYKGKSIDLDLSLVNSDEKIGWDGNYTSGNGILYSGDMTSAPEPNGASELIYIDSLKNRNYIMYVNFYNRRSFSDVKIPFDIFISEGDKNDVKGDYMVNPNKINCVCKTGIDATQQILGVVSSQNNKIRLYFAQTVMDTGITSIYSESARHARNYLIDFYGDAVYLNDLILSAGGKIVHEINEDTVIDVDLSPERIDKNTFIDLLK